MLHESIFIVDLHGGRQFISSSVVFYLEVWYYCVCLIF